MADHEEEPKGPSVKNLTAARMAKTIFANIGLSLFQHLGTVESSFTVRI